MDCWSIYSSSMIRKGITSFRSTWTMWRKIRSCSNTNYSNPFSNERAKRTKHGNQSITHCSSPLVRKSRAMGIKIWSRILRIAQVCSNEVINQRRIRLGTNRGRNVGFRRTLHADLNLAAFHYDESCDSITSKGKFTSVLDYLLRPMPDADYKFPLMYFRRTTDKQVHLRCQFNTGTYREIVAALQNLFDQHNELVWLFRMAHEGRSADDYVVVIRTNKTLDDQQERRYNAPIIYELAIVIIGKEFKLRDIVLHFLNGSI